jgi:SAM-dependent methyltransferase
LTWKALKSAEDIRDLLTSYQPAEVVTTAFEMGIFAALDSEGPQTAEELANTSESHPRSFAMLLNACVSLELLEFDEGTGCYHLTELAKRALVARSPEYLGNYIWLQKDIRGRWEKLRDSVIYNHRSVPEQHAREDGSSWEWNRQFILGLHDVARPLAEQVAEVLAPLLERKGVQSLIDVGAGSGAYSTALLTRLPQLAITLFDLPGPLTITRELIERPETKGVARFELCEGDFHKGSLGAASSFDTALLFGVLHSEKPQGRAELLLKICDVLTPGGLLVIRGPLLNRTKTAPLPDTFAALQTLLSTDNGQVLSLNEVRLLLMRCGFGQVQTRTLKNTNERLLLATKQTTKSK